MQKKIHIFFWLLLLCKLLTAQQNAVLYSLTEKNGLTDNVATCFFKDSKGIMWIGTNYGLNTYDGSEVTNYISGSNSISNNSINDIKEDENKNIWIATGNGLNKYSLNKKIFTSYNYAAKDNAFNRFYSLAILNNIIYLATEKGLVLFDIARQTFTISSNTNSTANHITKIYIDNLQRIWVGTYSGLWEYLPQTKTFINYDNPKNDVTLTDLVTDVIQSKNSTINWGNWNKGLKQLDIATKKIVSFSNYKNSNGNVTCLTLQKSKDGTEQLWVSGNLSSLNNTTHSFDNLLSSNKIISTNKMYCDNNNLLWISTNEGVKIYNSTKQYFNNASLSNTVPITSQGISLYPLPNQFLIGGEGATALQLYSNDLKFIKNISSKIFNGGAVVNIQQDALKNFWMCTSNGLYLFNSDLNLLKLLNKNERNPTSIPKNFINYSFQYNNNEVWITPWRKGVWVYNKSKQTFSRLLTANGDTLLPTNNISKIIVDNNKNLWFTDYSAGLFKYNTSNGLVENVIKENRLTNAYMVHQKLYTVTATAIFSIEVNSNNVDTFLLPQGNNKFTYDFIPDSANNLWITTKTGLLFFDIKTKQFKNFTTDDGLITTDLDATLAQLNNGNIILASSTYATSFNPFALINTTAKANLMLTKALANNVELNVDTSKLHLQWNDNNVQLHWALLHYSNPFGNQYFYKLDGVDKAWQSSGNKGLVTYNTLASGNYTFHYKAATSDGIVSEEKIITLIVHPPFWKTWWFRLLAIVLIGGIFYTVVKYISQRNLKEKLLQLEKEQAIEKERNRISKDMHDDLGSGLTKIAILTEVIKKDPVNAEKNINKISETSRQLVDNLDEMVWALNPKNDSLDKLIGYLAEYINQFLEATTIQPIIILPEIITPIYVSEEKRRHIFMVVKEFLNNTVKYSAAKCFTLQMIQSNTTFTLILKDDGKGFDINKENEMGNGLKNMQQRITDVGGVAILQSSHKGTILNIQFSNT